MPTGTFPLQSAYPSPAAYRVAKQTKSPTFNCGGVVQPSQVALYRAARETLRASRREWYGPRT